MLKKLALILLLALPIWAEPPVPKPHGGGDYWIYNEDTWLDWEVITAELAGRLTPSWPLDEAAPGALLQVDWLVPQWPVVARFGKGQRLQAVPDEGGGILIKDIDGSSWMKVQTPRGGFCFVRANAKYIRPIRVAARRTPVAPEPAPEQPAEERAVDPTLDEPAVERAADPTLDEPAVERAVDPTLDEPAVERAADPALDEPAVEAPTPES